MIKIEKSALVPYTASEMYQLAANVEAYTDFLPWCRSVEILEREEDRIVATVELAKGKLSKRFTTENLLSENESIAMHLVKGPFRHLEGRWRFKPLGEEGCSVSFSVEFEFSSRLLAKTLGPFFREIADKLVDAFVRRAGDLYGRR